MVVVVVWCVQANRDRFVLSNGHACALLYTMLHLTKYDVSMDDLKNFRQLGSKCVMGPCVGHRRAVAHCTLHVASFKCVAGCLCAEPQAIPKTTSPRVSRCPLVHWAKVRTVASQAMLVCCLASPPFTP